MSHPFGELLAQYRARKHGLSQARLAQIVGYDPAVIARMAQGHKDLTGPSGRAKVVRLMSALHDEGALHTLDEANALLHAANMPPLYEGIPEEAGLMRLLAKSPEQSVFRPAVHNLPAPLTSFVGREREIDELIEHVNASRLVTLTGTGGVGKTRLAIEVANRVMDRLSGGACWVELAPLQDGALAPKAVAMALNVREVFDEPVDETLKRHLGDKELLLVLDNCEHVLDLCAKLAESLLLGCRNLKVLTTSREPLSLIGEAIWHVQPLSLPACAVVAPMPNQLLAQSESVRLFCARATAVNRSFALTEHNQDAVAQLCRQLDGIPLAIELAAAQMRLLSAVQAAKRLGSRFDLLATGNRTALSRHQTMRATIDWSYGLLSQDEQALFRRLGVFVGGWTLAATEAVCSELRIDVKRAELRNASHDLTVLHLLESLVNKSLIKQGDVTNGESETRFTLLETLREYALERLEESGEAEAIRQRHAEFFIELTERLQPDMSSDERKVWFKHFDAEQDNFRAALRWALATRHAEHGLRLAGGLGEYWFWWASSWFEGWSWLSQLLSLPPATQPRLARANALRAAVNLRGYLGDTTEARRLADESLALYRELGDKAGVAWVLADTGRNAWNRADFADAVTACDESIATFRKIGDQRGLAWALLWRAGVAKDRGEFVEATALFEESIKAARSIGDASIAGNVYRLFGTLAHNTGDYERADAILRQSLALCQDGGDADGEHYTLACLARNALTLGDIAGAAAQLQVSESWFRQARQSNGLTDVLYQLGYIRHLQGRTREARVLLREALTLQWQQQLKLRLIQSLERCAWIAADMRQPQRTARLFGAAEAARERIGTPLPLGDKPLYDRHLAQARADLDSDGFDKAWAEGQAMTIDEAVDFALTGL